MKSLKIFVCFYNYANLLNKKIMTFFIKSLTIKVSTNVSQFMLYFNVYIFSEHESIKFQLKRMMGK